MVTKVEKFLEDIQVVQRKLNELDGNRYVLDGVEYVAHSLLLNPRVVDKITMGEYSPMVCLRPTVDSVGQGVLQFYIGLSNLSYLGWVAQMETAVSIEPATQEQLRAARLRAARLRAIDDIQRELDVMKAKAHVGAGELRWGRVIDRITRLQMQEW